MSWVGRICAVLLAIFWLTIESIYLGKVLTYQFILAILVAYFFGKQYDKANYYHNELGRTQKKLNEQLNKHLDEREGLYRMVVEISPNFIAIHQDERIVYANPSAVTMLGTKSQEKLIGQSIWDIIHADYHLVTSAYLKRLLKRKEEFIEIKFLNSNGEMINVELTFAQITYDGNPAILTIGKDITYRKKSEEKLAKVLQQLNESESKYRILFENASDLIVLFELSDGMPGKFINVNKKACEKLGYNLEEFLLLSPIDITPKENFNKVSSLIEQLYKDEFITFEGGYVSKKGQLIPFEFNARLIDFNGKESVLSIGRDITERKKKEEKIKHMAYYDNLTELPNRYLLFEFLGKTIKHNRTFSILFLDLDGFKEVNDHFGHKVGDLLLKEVAGRLKGVVREKDMVGRYGGDEFLVILRETDKDATFHIAERILDQFRNPYQLNGHESFITTSVGISRYPKDGENAKELIKKADKAMYMAKKQGKNTYHSY